MNFSNHYHRDQDGAELLSSQHHSETDFERAKAIGFNSIRFAFDGDWYVDSPDVFFEWLDQNVAWARQHDLRLILDLHTPIGGFWLDPTSDDGQFRPLVRSPAAAAERGPVARDRRPVQR